MYLGTAGDEQHARDARTVGQDVGPAGDLLGRVTGGLEQHRQLLAGEGQCSGAAPSLQRHAPGRSGLVAIGRADENQVGDGPQRRQLLDRLVGGAVLADPDRVVGPDVDDRQAHHCRQPHRWAHVVGEDQEGAAVGKQTAVQGHSIENGTHRVLPHTKTEVAPSGAITLEVSEALEQRDVGGGQVGRAADECGQGLSERVQHRARGFARGQRPVGGGEGGQRFLPSIGQPPRPQRVQQRGLFGVHRPVRLEGFTPLGLCLPPVLDCLPEHCQRLLSDQKARLGRPAQCLFCQLHLLLPKRRAVGSGCILLVGAAIGDVGVTDDE